MPELSKTYEPQDAEARIYASWEEGGYFRAEPDPSKKPFCIAIPPPNVTGALHLGHALDNTLQDVLTRMKRMQGYAALWIPGTDHAGIATQNVVEKEIKKQGLTRQDLGREKFVERVWEWKAEYGDRIIAQLKRLGSSCDWSRERFTMDPGLSRAVRKVFVDLYNEGLIYRGNRIINWCPRCETALSDIEVNHEDHHGELVRFRYMLSDGSGHLVVATTRLETMLGDTAIAVHPEDPRYSGFIGKTAKHPFFDREIPIVADEAVDTAFGTGAVKITPAHDPIDFDIAERHGLEKINILDGKASINENGGRFKGMDRFEAREAIRVELDQMGLLDGSDPHDYSIGHCDRCDTIVEPWLSEQWFVSMKPLAEPAIAAVKEGRTTFYPERWSNYYLNWMEQIRDWCISRQLWWGHRIPIWYCDACGNVWAAEEDPSDCAKCSSENIRQDPDVLDTWFSSQLWPFSTLGWPEKTADLEFFYPTSVIVPGYEIIHLWVSRMIMSGLHFMGDVPFAHAFIHGIVRDDEGKKMSKSLGNVIDPIELVDRFGTDALRFTLAEHATGQDIFLHEEWVSGSRNFANKLWNAARFVLMNAGEEVIDTSALQAPSDLADRWILSRLDATIEEVTAKIEAFDIAVAARTLYEFIWSEFCDWYVEVSKGRLYGDSKSDKAAVTAVLLKVLDVSVRLLHPLMPFVTEEIWLQLPIVRQAPSIMVSEWPTPAGTVDADAENQFGLIQQVVGEVRRFRSDHPIDLKASMRVVVVADDPEKTAAFELNRSTLDALARRCEFRFDKSFDAGNSVRLVAGGLDMFIPLEGLLDLDMERHRLSRAIATQHAEVERIGSKLANGSFTSKAPAAIVDEQRRRLAEAADAHSRLVAQLEQLGN
ncbi:MAG: valine--tRNA ligase [Actinomycetota bacterium]